MAEVRLTRVNKHYGGVQALHDVTLEVPDGAFVVFVGPSGCGKSTLLRAIAGLESITSGSIAIGGEDVTGVAPSDRGVSMVFQSYALYPHMSVRENMDFGMKINGVERSRRVARIAEAARILQLGDYLDRKPAQLSGGQRQRVAIGRAIVRDPKVFLFDEPLSNLDAKLRIQMRVELETLHQQLHATMIYVTHDQVEAMTMADQIVVLNEGRVEQVGPPLELYRRPRTVFVAGFIGAPSMNFLDVAAGHGALRYGSTPLMLAADGAARLLGIRPEHIEITAPGGGTFDATVEVKEALGGESYVYLRTAEGDRLVAKADGEHPASRGDVVGLMLPPRRLHLFGADGLALPVTTPQTGGTA
jgi:ABC-type sugar transport system ATPase subunit